MTEEQIIALQQENEVMKSILKRIIKYEQDEDLCFNEQTKLESGLECFCRNSQENICEGCPYEILEEWDAIKSDFLALNI